MEYNPHKPQILGQEWVPIREEPNLVAMSYFPAGVTEYGNSFTLTSTQLIQDVRFYTNDNTRPITMANIYAAGDETQAGPVRRVVIPCNNGALTGTNTAFVLGSSAAECLQNPFDVKYVNVPFNATITPPDTTQFSAYFGVNNYAPLLLNKRIVQVNLLFAMRSAINDAVTSFTPSVNATLYMNLNIRVNNGSSKIDVANSSADWTVPGVTVTPLPWYDEILVNQGTTTQPVTVWRLGLGNVVSRSGNTPSAFPWTFSELARFEISDANRLAINFNTYLDRGTSGLTASGIANALQYMALEVFYCEETRLAMGTLPLTTVLTMGQGPEPLICPVYTPARAANPALPAGNYVVSVSSASFSDYNALTLPTPPFNGRGLREYYSLPNLTSYVTTIPSPFDETVAGKVFTEQATHLIPQISVHTSGGPVTDVHVYGQQAVGQVYGANTVSQNVLDTGLSARTYQAVRFYARRFGNTTTPLVLSSTSPTVSGSSASLSVTTFDALSSIIDGWKEITLRFSSPPTMGAGTNPTWTWSAAAETQENRWEILGAAAPALSAVPGNSLNQVVSTHRLGSATYGAPSAGTTINMSWMPGISPLVSGSTADAFSDAVLLFASDMPTVTGLAISQQTQPLTGLGLGCGYACCQPTGIRYNQITWSATSSSVPVSGFNYYELQRSDTIDTNWVTIMKNTSPSGASFNDYEARVGVQSSYRIRAMGVLNFDGPWSSTVSATLASPGVSGGYCINTGHVLIFTSNYRQSGSINLAYSEAWQGAETIVEEPFGFLEGGMDTTQGMYNKNFPTVFRPTERGGEVFTRTLLVQSAAIPAPNAGNFKSLRDMAWDQVPYICVRDEAGNRWFASVSVPDGNLQLSRKLYFATATITQVSADPYAVVTT